MGDVIRTKLRRIKAGILACFALIFLFAVIFLWQYETVNVDLGLIRVKVNNLLSNLEQCEDDSWIPNESSDLTYAVFSLDGTVLYSNLSGYDKGNQVDLHKIGSTNNYTVPLIRDGKAFGLFYVDIKAYGEELASEAIIPKVGMLLVVLVFAFLLYLWYQRVMRIDVWNPVQELHTVTKRMRAGDMEAALTYDYDGEIGTLCHDFECMREDIIQAHEREQVLQDKERALYASISHDLKTPLASITGYLEELIYGVITVPEEIKKAQERMLDKANVLNQLISDILEHSKAQLGQLTIQKKEVYAKDYFEKLLHGYQTDAELNHYRLAYELPEDVILFIDPDRIAQVVQNLMDNAIKYRKKVLHIDVSFSSIEEPSTMLIVSVKDNGQGIDAEDLPFIFDLFYRGNKARTQDVPGSGLGLNISKYIVEQHGGRIECDSIAKEGTTISFSIPY